MDRRPPNWKVIQDVNLKKFSNGGVIMVEDDHDVINFDNSYDLALSTSLNDLDFATLNIDGQSMDVDAPPDIINVYEYGDFIDDEDFVPHDLADFDDEVLAIDDDDDDPDVTVVVMIVPLHVRLAPIAEGRPKPQQGRQESRQTRDPRGNQEPRPSDPDLHRTSSMQIEICRLTIGLILRTMPEAFKMLKAGQRARSSAYRASRLESIRPSSRPTSTHTVDSVFTQDEARVQYRKLNWGYYFMNQQS
nr:hypothetical protein [Tanacetum cinerariifolium]